VKIFVGNLDFRTGEDEVRTAFAQYGNVDSVTVVKDRDTGQSRRFAFVEMANGEEARTAMKRLDGYEMNGRAIKVNEARPKSGGDRYGRAGLRAGKIGRLWRGYLGNACR
jgi:cold-inducible RNA-binding protein